jgi:hypothetical protein
MHYDVDSEISHMLDKPKRGLKFTTGKHPYKFVSQNVDRAVNKIIFGGMATKIYKKCICCLHHVCLPQLRNR